MHRRVQLVTNTLLGRRQKPCLPRSRPTKWFYKLFNNFYINKRTKTTKPNKWLPTFQVLHITYTNCTICESSQIIYVCVCVHFILNFKYRVFNAWGWSAMTETYSTRLRKFVVADHIRASFLNRSACQCNRTRYLRTNQRRETQYDWKFSHIRKF